MPLKNWAEISPYFKLEELCSPNSLKYAHKLDLPSVRLWNRLREEWGLVIYINTWSWGGRVFNGCLRTVRDNLDTGGASESMHLTGRAADFKCTGYGGHELLEGFQKLPSFKEVTYVKIYPWGIHIDNRLTDKLIVEYD